MSDTPKQPTPDEIRDALTYGRASGDYTRFNMLSGQNALARKVKMEEQAAQLAAANREKDERLQQMLNDRSLAAKNDPAGPGTAAPRRRPGIHGMFAWSR